MANDDCLGCLEGGGNSNATIQTPVYFPGLNGLRAIAAIAVVLSHTTQHLGRFNLNPYILGRTSEGEPQGLNLASFGVSIFFALSGFLITYLLLLEREKNGTTNIKNFYARRILRIWPLYYLYLILALVTTIKYGLGWDSPTLGLYVFYAANVPVILGTSFSLLAHYWSLGIEEQYYLFWPWLVRSASSRLLSITFALAMFLGISKCAAHFLLPGSLLEIAMKVCRFPCMMIGAMGAMLYYC